MAFDLFSQESSARLDSLRPVTRPDPGAFDNFLTGTGQVAMRGMAETGRAASLAFSAIPVAIDKAASLAKGKETTDAQDSYFSTVHDPVFKRAVDRWTPSSGEVGSAAEITGQLLSTLPLIVASPAAAIAATGLSTAESLSNKRVTTGKAIATGAVQAAGLGLGVWMPILGNNLWQRTLIGGAGFNVAQGVATRGASSAILQGTPAAEDFKAFDGEALTLDALLGLAFGGLAHLSPSSRKQGSDAWTRIEEWAGKLKPSEVDAIATLRQAQHMNLDSTPGRPADIPDIDKHVQAMRQAIDDLVNDRPVNVEDLVGSAKFIADPARAADQAQMVKVMDAEATAIAKELGVEPTPPADMTVRQDATMARPIDAPVSPEAADKTGQPKTQDPVASEASRFAADNPDVPLSIGKDAEGNPITKSVRQYLEESDGMVLQAQDDARLFEVAAACMMGAA